MKVLITGATGLVGKALTKRCLDNGISVHYLTTSKDKIEKKPNYNGYYWNPRKGLIDEAAFEDIDTIIHLAGASIAERWTPKHREAIIDSRIKSAQLIYSTISRNRKQDAPKTIKNIISASAIGGYPSSLTKYYDEKYPDYASGFLGGVVEEWESSVLEFERLDIAATLVRTGLILDKEEGALPKLMEPINYGAGAPLGSGKQWQSWIHIEDMAGIYFHLLQKGLAGTYNAVAPNPVTNKELTKAVAKQLGKPLVLPNVPKFALKLLLGDMSAVVLESQKVCADKIKESGYVFKFEQLTPALSNLLN